MSILNRRCTEEAERFTTFIFGVENEKNLNNGVVVFGADVNSGKPYGFQIG